MCVRACVPPLTPKTYSPSPRNAVSFHATLGNRGARAARDEAGGGGGGDSSASEHRSHEFPKVVENAIMLRFGSEPSDDASSVLSVAGELSDENEKLASSSACCSPSSRSMTRLRQYME
ncbi:unnamed protein product [Merluccius merluccius]